MKGNQRLRNLVDYLGKHDWRFSISFRSPIGIRRVSDLRKRILAEWDIGESETLDTYKKAFLDPKIQEAFQLREVDAVDLTEDLDLQKGRVYGLCLNDVGPTYSLKDPVISGLFLMNLMTPDLPLEDLDTLADCGIFNSANCTKHYAKRFGLRGEYWMPSSVEHIARRVSSDNFLVHHENEEMAQRFPEEKNACYMTLVDRLVTDEEFKKRTFYLGHSELGWVAMYPFAQKSAELLEQRKINPTILLSGVGAGTFFVPHSEVFYQRFGTRSVLAESKMFHPMTDIHKLKIHVMESMPNYLAESTVQESRKSKSSGWNTIVRRFSENPFIPNKFWERVEESYLLGDESVDLATVMHFRERGKNIGITTGAVIALAYDLARKGETVVVPIYEKFRNYSK